MPTRTSNPAGLGVKMNELTVKKKGRRGFREQLSLKILEKRVQGLLPSSAIE